MILSSRCMGIRHWIRVFNVDEILKDECIGENNEIPGKIRMVEFYGYRRWHWGDRCKQV